MKLTDAYRTLMQRQCDLRRDLMQERIDTQAVRHRMEASYVADASRMLRADRVGYTGTSWLKYENCTSLRVSIELELMLIRQFPLVAGLREINPNCFEVIQAQN